METKVNDDISKALDEMKQSFQDGVDAIYNAIVAQGTTPSSKSPEDIIASVNTMATSKYNSGYSNGYNSGTNVGISCHLTGRGAGVGWQLYLYKNGSQVNWKKGDTYNSNYADFSDWIYG